MIVGSSSPTPVRFTRRDTGHSQSALSAAGRNAGPRRASHKRAIFTAASHAQKAADYLHALQPDSAAATDDDRREVA